MKEIDFQSLSYLKKYYEHCLAEALKSDLNLGFSVFAEILYTKSVKTQQELSDLALCNKAHTSRMIFKMQLKGLVKTSTLSRNSAITLTKKGEEFAKTCIETKEKVKQKLLENINKKDLEVFSNVIDQILANARVFETETKE